jgi:nifR3 family TIM-barrel protein
MIQLKRLMLRECFIQSPMAGCTDLAFRLIGREHGLELSFLEMISAEALVRKNRKTFALLKRTDEDKPLGAQLVGARPEVMAEAAQIIEDMNFDILDINLGCPVPKITGSGAGCALMASPQTAQKIFKSVTGTIRRIPVTVKMRKGYADPSGKEALLIAKMAEDAGLSAVMIHGRTRAQGYRGNADWGIIREIKRAVRIPVFGNGDIFTGSDAARMTASTGCDGVLVGRGALGNPWIYLAIRNAIETGREPLPPDFHETKKTALRHFELELRYEGEKIGLLKSRKILCWYFKQIAGASKFRNAIHSAQTEGDMRRALESLKSGLSAGNG